MQWIFKGILGIAVLALMQCKADPKAQKNVASQGEAALDKLTALIRKNPDDPTLLYERAKLAYSSENYDQVIMDLEKAIKIDSLVPEYYHLLSDASMDYYRSKDALQTMQEAGEIFPERIPTLLKLSETQLILKQNEASLFTIARILTINPQNADAHFMTGMNFRAMGETDRAINAFQKATELDPEITDAWLLIGDLFEQKGDTRALEYYDAAINSDLDNPATWHSKAYYLQNHDRDDEAIAIYKQINKIDKNYVDAYLNTGILYMTKDSIDKAFEQFDIMASIKAQDYRPYYYRGLCYEKKGNLKAARADFQNCLNLKPDFEKATRAMHGLSAG